MYHSFFTANRFQQLGGKKPEFPASQWKNADFAHSWCVKSRNVNLNSVQLHRLPYNQLNLQGTFNTKYHLTHQFGI